MINKERLEDEVGHICRCYDQHQKPCHLSNGFEKEENYLDDLNKDDAKVL